jgi:hypothetical protein
MAKEKDICRQLGVTPAGLRVLAKAAASPDGSAYGPGFGHAAAGARGKLIAAGLITKAEGDLPQGSITEKGRAIVAKARELGW